MTAARHGTARERSARSGLTGALLWACIVVTGSGGDLGAQELSARCHPDESEECGLAGSLAAPIPSAGPAACTDAEADGFACERVALGRWLDVREIGGGAGNDIWGWVDPESGREIALYGRTTGTSFVDVTDPENPLYLGELPRHDGPSTWRDIKVYADHAFIVSESSAHGMQVFDLTQLRPYENGDAVLEETAHYDGFGNAHNIAIDADSGFAYALGSNRCRGGLEILDIRTPSAPIRAGCFDGDGYTHDAQCVVYRGRDLDYTGRQICFAANEDALSIVDVTDKSAPRLVSRTTYPGLAYAHQVALTQDHGFLLVDDELDEGATRHRTRTHIVELVELESPQVRHPYTSHLNATDHNQYVVGDYAFQANYSSGLRILDVSSIAEGRVCEVASFDTHPPSDRPGFQGAWSVYPYFPSGTVVVSDRAGLAVVRPDHEGAPCIELPPLVQSPVQRRCLARWDTAIGQVASAVSQTLLACVRDAALGREQDVEACISADARGRLARAHLRAEAAEERCSTGEYPDFGAAHNRHLSEVVIEQRLSLAHDLLGDDIDAALSPETDRCRAPVLKQFESLANAQQREFARCARSGLRSGAIGNADELVSCTLRMRLSQSVSRARTRLAATLRSPRCAELDPAAVLPGRCAARRDAAHCAHELGTCRSCLMLNAVHGLRTDCDHLDNDLRDGSCPVP